MKPKLCVIVAATLAMGCLAAGLVFAQQRGWGDYGGRGYGGYSRDVSDRNGVPDWQVDPQFKKDLFTFVRVRYSSAGYGRRRGGDWATDYPDADLNLSFRLQQLTSLKVDPNPKVVELTDDALFDYPFIYMIEPGNLYFDDDEIVALRRYLTNGGFMMVDDFWGEYEYQNFYEQMKRVFPEAKQEPVELDISHPIFSCVYQLKEKPQVPSIGMAYRGRAAGITWERSDAREVHFKAIYDDKDRMMVIICHNTDLGDGWEREGEDEWYFKEFSEKKAYPMGINIVFYAMTH
ncbi:MAG TPA: DUF4159 domain-containing protein [Tepidisphaeraceae bacterium]|nr:DUF4159 domain-containing protein [Tepidisphaeraceae bacterium]